MVAIVRVLGLAAAMLSECVSFPYNDKCSALLEKLVTSNKEINQALKKIDKKLDALILGDIDAAGISIGKSTSTDLDMSEKKDEIKYAIRQLERGYSRLGYLPELLLYRGEIASQISVCYVFLEKNLLASQWLKKSIEDLQTVHDLKERRVSSVERTAYDACLGALNMWEKGGTIEATTGFFLYVPTLLAFPLLNSAESKDKFNEKVQKDRRDARVLLDAAQTMLPLLMT